MKSCLSEHALVLGGQNGLYRVELQEEPKRILLCHGASKIRKDGFKLMAGDRVTVEDNGDGTGFIRGIDERINELTRPPVANVDLLLPVIAVTRPEPVPYHLDKLLVIAQKQKIPVALVFTKAELGDAEELMQAYRLAGYPVYTVSEHGKNGSEALRALLRGKVSVFCGASGVGKSTLLNSLFPELNAETGALSEKIQRGKNTTRTTTLYPLSGNSYLADTPGFTLLETDRYCQITPEELPTLFPEFEKPLASCRYTRCTHLCEEGCGVIAALERGEISPSRHESYCRLYKERKSNPSYTQELNRKGSV